MGSVTPLIDLRPDHLAIVQDILRQHLPKAEVWAYGSRVAWTSEEYSDLDLVVRNHPNPLKAISGGTVQDAREALTQSSLPFRVDLFDWAELPTVFHQEILKGYMAVQKGRCGVMGWQEIKLSDAVLINPQVKLLSGKKIPFVDMKAIQIGKKFVSSSEERTYSGGGSKFINNDTLMARITPCLENGKIAQYKGNNGVVANGSTEFIVFRGKSNYTDSQFVYYLIKSSDLRNFSIGQMTGTSGRQRVPNDCFSKYYIKLPPLPEQRAIAAILGALDDKIELNNRMNATLEAMARALFKSWFVDFDPVKAKMAGRQPFGMDAATAALFPSSFIQSELGDIPEGWMVKLFKDAVNFYNSKRVPLSSREREQRRGDYRYYGATSVMDYIDSYLFDGTYVLVGEDGSVITEKGFPFLQYVWGQFWVNNHAHILQGKNGWSTEAIYLILAQSNVQHLVTGAVQPKLSMGNLSALKFICSSPQITTAFCDQIAVFFEKRKSISNENAELERTRDYLLPKLISGEIRIPDVEKFVEGLI